MPEKARLSNAMTSYAKLKVHESIFIWLGSLMVWHGIFSVCGTNIENFEYLQWGATALTVVLVTKLIMSRNHINFSTFLGNSIVLRSLPEISLVTALAIMLGIGCWTILVLIETHVDPVWAYRWWGLVTPAEFDGIRWSKSWLVVDAISGVILVPITEEIIFRGLILRRLIIKYDPQIAVVMSSFIFSLFHINKSFVGSFFHAVLFAVLAIRFMSLYAPMVAHGAYNLFAFVSQTWLGSFLAVDKSKIESLAYWAPEMACLFLGVAGFALYIAKTYRSLGSS